MIIITYYPYCADTTFQQHPLPREYIPFVGSLVVLHLNHRDTISGIAKAYNQGSVQGKYGLINWNSVSSTCVCKVGFFICTSPLKVYCFQRTHECQAHGRDHT